MPPPSRPNGPRLIPVADLDHPQLEPYRNQKDAWLRAQRLGGTGLPDPAGQDGLFIAEGELVVRALFESACQVCSVLLTPARLRTMRQAIDRLPADTPVFLADRDVLARIVGFDVHRGVLAVGRRTHRPDAMELARSAQCLLVLEGLTNHDNVGSLFRSFSALAPRPLAVLLCPRCADPFYRKSLRVSMGHVLTVPSARLEQWPADLLRLEKLGYQTIALTPSPQATALSQLPVRCPPQRVALLVGAEGPGLTPQAMDAAAWRVRIEMHPGVDSLNVAVSAAIALATLCRPHPSAGPPDAPLATDSQTLGPKRGTTRPGERL
ncbi:MAG: hypothetical tRNA/rRNA methyltransferase [Phycisphaerales bacterium]|nr:MAG: hypothetical tRNA/rRNA methyltransferase [Phycisphaerales bacterium]